MHETGIGLGDQDVVAGQRCVVLERGPFPEVVVEAEAQAGRACGGARLVEIGGVGAPGRGGGQAADLGEVAVGREERDRARRIDDVALADGERVVDLRLPGGSVEGLRHALMAGRRAQAGVAQRRLELGGGVSGEACVLDRAVADPGQGVERPLRVRRHLVAQRVELDADVLARDRAAVLVAMSAVRQRGRRAERHGSERSSCRSAAQEVAPVKTLSVVAHGCVSSSGTFVSVLSPPDSALVAPASRR